MHESSAMRKRAGGGAGTSRLPRSGSHRQPEAAELKAESRWRTTAPSRVRSASTAPRAAIPRRPKLRRGAVCATRISRRAAGKP
eukprot:305745-Prymnesium_polylepis.2